MLLINPEWLEHYKYSEIKKIVSDIYQKFPDPTHFWNGTYELNSVSTILSQVNDVNIKELDKKINVENKKQYYCNPEMVNIQGKSIPLYKRFILIYKQFHDHFRKYFSIKTNYDILYYKNKYEEDYIILENYPLLNQNYYGNYNNNVLNIILFGDIDKKENKFHIKGIFDYLNKGFLNSEIKNLITYDTYGKAYYLNDRTVFNNHDKNDLISPIFSKDNIIGSYYKYENVDYNKCINYMAYYNNKLLQNIIYLYINEKEINNNIKGTSFKDVKSKFSKILKKNIIMKN